ncbi:hypothetical protein KUH03_41200 [Sphingobacterium sp. E70]|uniref:sialate O-acetylesterase n=1 Tax=Sphingobacterium sp. E70 TaxID=2853439 RepID=UPI00211C4BEC|nr:sialate O-acetylesterase [Sphingobacterium sp. E70]ULT25179.1 hypothetical protein KUH03_41200 [Sphingobacterium sp. E70]
MEINELVIRDILIGDVWLCSGQSNMETPIQRLVERFPEINVSNNHMIRYFKVPTQNSALEPKEAILSGARWHSGIASDVMNWTALAYFYAQESYQHNGIPVGMLVSSLGGSGIESWIDQQHLKQFPDLLIDRAAVDSLQILEKIRARTYGPLKTLTTRPGQLCKYLIIGVIKRIQTGYCLLSKAFYASSGQRRSACEIVFGHLD